MGTTVRKNGKAYDSGDVVLEHLGTVESEVKEITYSTDQEHQLNHGLANGATSWSRGKITHEGKLTLYMASVVKLEKLARDSGGSTILDLAPFDTQVSFINEFNDTINDTVTWKFKKTGRTVNGEMGLAQEFDMFVLGIDYNNG